MPRLNKYGRSALVGLAILLPTIVPAATYLCTFVDADYRKLLESWRQSTPQPTIQESTEDIVRYRAWIMDAATAFQVDPLVIAGVMYTEQTLNRNPAKSFEGYYVRSYLLALSEDELQRQLKQTKIDIQRSRASEHEGWTLPFRSEHPLTWSIGVGRVSVLTALEIEDDLAMYDHRKRRGIREVIEALLDPRENLRYCAFELRRDRVIYKEVTGYDIGNRSDLQASLYNLGNVRAVAKRTVKEMRQPVPNPFGEYTLSHMKDVKAALFQSL